MPPRHTYWTIILDGKPTAFRAHTEEELQPTLKQLIAIRGSNGPFGSIYHLNAIQSWAISETGDVANVHA